MKIDLQIGYDDLSKECKEQIKNLKLLGFNVTLHYPTLQKSGISFGSDVTLNYSDMSPLIMARHAEPEITCTGSN